MLGKTAGKVTTFFFAAGADLIMTNTYQASVGGFMEYLDISAEESVALMEKAVKMAKTACDRFMLEYQKGTCFIDLKSSHKMQVKISVLLRLTRTYWSK